MGYTKPQNAPPANTAPRLIRIEGIRAVPVYGSWWRWLLRWPAEWRIDYSVTGPWPIPDPKPRPQTDAGGGVVGW